MKLGQFLTATIQRKMLLGFILVIGLVVGMIVATYYQLSLVRASSRQIPSGSVQLEALQEYALALSSLDANLERLFVIGGGQFQEAVQSDLETMNTSLGLIGEYVSSENRPVFEQLQTETRALNTAALQLLGEDPNRRSSRQLNEQIIALYGRADKANSLHKTLTQQISTQLQQTAANQTEVVSNVSLQVVVVGSVVSLLMVGISLLVTRSIAGPLANLTETAQQIEQGNLQAQAIVSTHDEVGQLAQSFNSMTRQLRETLEGLEEQVTLRTQRLETIVTLGERLTSILNVEQLLQELVDQVKEKFNYYHTHVYLLDDAGHHLVVKAGAGEAGAALKKSGHKIALNAPTSLVARAARTGDVVRVDNVRQSADWLPNPLLPHTNSEMAIPIWIEGEVVGVLDVQHDKIGGLDSSDASVLRFLASLVAVAINNAQLFTQVESALVDARAIQDRYLQQTWDRRKFARKNVGRVQFSLGESTALTELAIEQARRQSRQLAEPTVTDLEPDPTGHAAPYRTLVAPLRLRGVNIGNLQLHDVDGSRQWSEGELALITAVVDQLVQAAETIRLLNETQERASREQLIGHISDRLRRAPDMETLLKTGVEEISRVLDPARTFVQLGSVEELLPHPAAVETAAPEPGAAAHSSAATNGHGDRQL